MADKPAVRYLLMAVPAAGWERITNALHTAGYGMFSEVDVDLVDDPLNERLSTPKIEKIRLAEGTEE